MRRSILLTPALACALVLSACQAPAGSGATGSLGSALGNALTNGDFETGNLGGWTSSGSTLAVKNAHHGGSYSARLGAYSATARSELTQQVVVPTSGPALSVWYQGHCAGTVSTDWAAVEVRDASSGAVLKTVLAKTCTSGAGWQNVTADLSALAGRTVVVALINQDNGDANVTYTYFDDVVLSGTTSTSDFSVAVSPATVDLSSGGSASATLSTTVTSGSAQSLSLSATGLPAGVTASFSPQTLTAGQSATVTFSDDGTATAGVSTVTLTATGAKTHSASVDLTVSGADAGTSSALVNGDFETGTLAGWTSSGSTLAVANAHHSGSYSGRVGASGYTGHSELTQAVTIPGGQATLSVWYQSHCSGVSTNGSSVEVRSGTGSVLATVLTRTCTSGAGWKNATADLSAFQGETVTLALINQDDDGTSTYTYFDDVVLTGSGDTTAPVASLTAPGSGSTLSGTVTLTASASDNVAVTRVEFYADGQLLGQDTASPYSLSWSSIAVANGTHTLSARAYDAAGNVGTSAGVSVTVSNGASDGGTGVGPDGGTVDHLYFAVIGDTRPGTIDDTANYPTVIVDKIYQDVQALSPRPQFMVATGDYMFASTGGTEAAKQIALYANAARAFQGPLFAAMGNHECTGYTSSNCATSTTNNYTAFVQTLVTPLGKTKPYYVVPFQGTDGAWTAKLIVIACNAWSTTQKSWLQSELATPTTYTILARHEPATATTGPCVNDVEALMAQYPYDLSLVGHTHTFSHPSTKEIVVGTGGAPLTSSATPYGWATVEKVSGGFKISQYDVSTGLPVSTFTVP